MTKRPTDSFPNTLKAEERQVLLQEERENHRYQDGLRWSRIQTVAVIEGGLLWAIFWQPVSNVLNLILAVGGSLMVFLVCLMALKDSSDARWHITRIRRLEKLTGATIEPLRKQRFFLVL